MLSSQVMASLPSVRAGWALDDGSRWWGPALGHGSMPPLRMGPPPRSFAADAHACIMVRVTATHRIQGCGASPSCPDSELPSDASSRPQQRAAVLGAVKARPGNDGA